MIALDKEGVGTVHPSAPILLKQRPSRRPFLSLKAFLGHLANY